MKKETTIVTSIVGENINHIKLEVMVIK